MFDKDLSVLIEGTGAWKSISLVKNATGEVMEEKKFYKAEFKEIISSPEWNPYVMTVFNATYSEIMGKPLENADLDPEAYEEMRQVAIDLEVDPSAFDDL